MHEKIEEFLSERGIDIRFPVYNKDESQMWDVAALLVEFTEITTSKEAAKPL